MMALCSILVAIGPWRSLGAWGAVALAVGVIAAFASALRARGSLCTILALDAVLTHGAVEALADGLSLGVVEDGPHARVGGVRPGGSLGEFMQSPSLLGGEALGALAGIGAFA